MNEYQDFIRIIYGEIIPAIDKAISQSMLERKIGFGCSLKSKNDGELVDKRIEELDQIISEYLSCRKSMEVKEVREVFIDGECMNEIAVSQRGYIL